ncbi:class I SAM-dependent methyltransferase [Algibacter sp.]|nr:class I SAM-dependent methyltransferase [Algibacter sp.]
MSKYIHDEDTHNLRAPKKIVPEIIKILNPKSVVDFGCGIGTFLNVFKQYDVKDILGLDGPWANKSLLFKYIDAEEFQECNLEEEIKLSKKYDLVLSLEVAEHLSIDSADMFVQNLINSGNVILFSAAIPNQGGQNHINEQWLTYWEAKFLKHNYVIHDIIRPLFWDDPEIFWWYKQNMVLVTPKNFMFDFNVKYCPIRNVVHYELFNSKINELKLINTGKLKKIFYLKLLLKSILGEQIVKKAKLMLTKNKHH